MKNLTRWAGKRGSDHSKPGPYRRHRADARARAVRGGFPRRTPRGTPSPFRTGGLSGLAAGAGTDRSVPVRALARERRRVPGVGPGTHPVGRAGGNFLRRDRGPAGLSAARAGTRLPSPRSPRPRGQGRNGGRAAPRGHRHIRARAGPNFAGCEALDRRERPPGPGEPGTDGRTAAAGSALGRARAGLARRAARLPSPRARPVPLEAPAAPRDARLGPREQVRLGRSFPHETTSWDPGSKIPADFTAPRGEGIPARALRRQPPLRRGQAR